MKTVNLQYFKESYFINMNSPGAKSSPKFKNLRNIQRNNSPIELKDKMRKNYKEKIQNCRGMILNRFRGAIEETDLRNTLTEIYKNMFNIPNTLTSDDEEINILDEIKNELIQEEFEWWLEEYEKAQMDLDWSSLEEENNVICPICQKNNLSLFNNILSCSYCKCDIKTQQSLSDVKQSILLSLEKHSSVCSNEFQFALVQELNESHIYLICNSCFEMKIVV